MVLQHLLHIWKFTGDGLLVQLVVQDHLPLVIKQLLVVLTLLLSIMELLHHQMEHLHLDMGLKLVDIGLQQWDFKPRHPTMDL